MKWWEGKDYDRLQAMTFPRLDRGPFERLTAGPEDECRKAVRIFSRKTWKPSR